MVEHFEAFQLKSSSCRTSVCLAFSGGGEGRLGIERLINASLGLH